MYQKKEMEQRFNKVRKKLWITLFINWFVPLTVVILIRSIYHNDVMALAIGGAIPVVRTISILVLRKRIDWIGSVGALGFIVAFIISALSNGSSLPLKLYHPIITGIVGLILLISVFIRKPILIIILQKLKHGDPSHFNNQANYKKFTFLTLFLGAILVVDAIIHIIIALTLSTVSYMAVSKVITWTMILIIILVRKWTAGKGSAD